MIVARALGVTALDLFESTRSSRGGRPPIAADEGVPALDDEELAWLHRAALVVRLLPVPPPPVRLGPALRADLSRDPGAGLVAGPLA
jgi:hypothetical protein